MKKCHENRAAIWAKSMVLLCISSRTVCSQKQTKNLNLTTKTFKKLITFNRVSSLLVFILFEFAQRIDQRQKKSHIK